MEANELLTKLVELLSKNVASQPTKRKYTKKEGLTYGAKAAGNRDHLELYNISKKIAGASTAIARLENLAVERNVQEHQRPAYLLAATELVNLKRFVAERQSNIDNVKTEADVVQPTEHIVATVILPKTAPPEPIIESSILPPPTPMQAEVKDEEPSQLTQTADLPADEPDFKSKRPCPTYAGAAPLGLDSPPNMDARATPKQEQQHQRLLRLRALWNA